MSVFSLLLYMYNCIIYIIKLNQNVVMYVLYRPGGSNFQLVGSLVRAYLWAAQPRMDERDRREVSKRRRRESMLGGSGGMLPLEIFEKSSPFAAF